MKKTMLFIGSVIILILSAITFIFIPAMAQGAGQDSLVFGKYGNKKRCVPDRRRCHGLDQLDLQPRAKGLSKNIHGGADP